MSSSAAWENLRMATFRGEEQTEDLVGPFLHLPGDLDLLLTREQRHVTDAAQIDEHGG